jgi:hypothetical protein
MLQMSQNILSHSYCANSMQVFLESVVGGGLSLSTGIATDGDSGAVVISSGSLARAQSHSRLG